MNGTSTKEQINDFFKKLHSMGCITRVWEKVLETLCLLEKNISFEALAIFCIYFSQLDDGNTCIPLDAKKLTEKWQKKWEGLLLQENRLYQKEADNKYFAAIIEKGLPQITPQILPELIVCDTSDKSKPFVIDSGWLFAEKYFKAKINIEEKINEIMKQNPTSLSEDKIAGTRDYFKNLTSSDSSEPMILKDEQILALLRGLDNNLIITGGPGTGKTTVVCYILWELFRTKGMMDYALYLAAPSGKAADRLKESITDSLSKLNTQNFSSHEQEIFDKLNNAQASTIHRLLNYNSSNNGFNYNSEDPFDKKSIFVIDEASMIDITLFSSLLEAIPKEAKVLILGDKDQLPSVQAGAVLGELLAKKTDSVAELKQSKRFNDKSEIGRLKNAMQEDQPLKKELTNQIQWKEWKKDNSFSLPSDKLPQEKQFPVVSIIPEADEKERIEQIDEIAERWCSTFYSSIVLDVSLLQNNFTLEKLDYIWEKSIISRILCAERKGPQGVIEINKKICAYIRKNNITNKNLEDDYFPGQFLILTKNQSIFCLYNGDSGIVIERNGLKYFMVKKEADNKGADDNEYGKSGIFHVGNYIFYPLHLLPAESLETAYAITIHKSQGSDYKAILVFLPSQKGHPLLNRQIAYTAITRTKGSTYIFADYESLENARKTIIQRDTLISLN